MRCQTNKLVGVKYARRNIFARTVTFARLKLQLNLSNSGKIMLN